MKRLLTSILGAVIAIAAPFAHADTIQFTGNVSFTPSTGSVTFDNTLSKVNTGGTGVLGSFTTSSVVTFNNFNYTTPFPSGGKQLFSATATDGSTLNFFFTSDNVSSSPAGTSGFTNYEMSGVGFYNLTPSGGSTTTFSGAFDLTTQGQGSNTTRLSFSDLNVTTAATPEPSSLVLLGTGLFSAGSMLIRRRRVNVTA